MARTGTAVITTNRWLELATAQIRRCVSAEGDYRVVSLHDQASTFGAFGQTDWPVVWEKQFSFDQSIPLQCCPTPPFESARWEAGNAQCPDT